MVDYTDPKFKNEIRAQFEAQGEEQVRTLMQSGHWTTHLTPIAMEWLKEKRQESARLTVASQAEMAETASRAADAAERAAKAAEEQARAAEAQARIAQKALRTARVATAIAAAALIVSVIAALHVLS